jgi:hypothetical protein
LRATATIVSLVALQLGTASVLVGSAARAAPRTWDQTPVSAGIVAAALACETADQTVGVVCPGSRYLVVKRSSGCGDCLFPVRVQGRRWFRRPNGDVVRILSSRDLARERARGKGRTVGWLTLDLEWQTETSIWVRLNAEALDLAQPDSQIGVACGSAEFSLVKREGRWTCGDAAVESQPDCGN